MEVVNKVDAIPGGRSERSGSSSTSDSNYARCTDVCRVFLCYPL